MTRTEETERPYAKLAKRTLLQRMEEYKRHINELENQYESKRKERYDRLLSQGRSITGQNCWQAAAMASHYCDDYNGYEQQNIVKLRREYNVLSNELLRRK